MKTIKRISALVLVVILMMSVMIMPASAATNPDFYHFPLVTVAMKNGYMSAAVAIQKFLLLYDPISYMEINSNGGTDGFFGDGSESATKHFQSEERLTSDGKVGSLTWLKICELLKYQDGNDTDLDHYLLVNNSGASISNNRVILRYNGYRSINREGVPKEVFYPTSN